MADRIQYRRDTAARWAQFNPILLEGEVGYVTNDPNQYKIGDGVHTWNDLPLRGFNGNVVQETGTDENAVMSQKSVTENLSTLQNQTSSVGYVSCNTAAGTAAKTIAVTGLTALTTGIRLLVKMENNNTANNATLNINSLGAKPLYYNNNRVSGSNTWEAGEVIEVYYDGTNFNSNNILGGSDGSNGNMILEWNTDVATTRKQVKASDRKAGMQISYLHPDNGWINEQYIGIAVTDTEWVSNENWLKNAMAKDINSSFFIVDDEINRASIHISLENRKTGQFVKFVEYFKPTIIITIDGIAETNGEIEITYNNNSHTVIITAGDDYNAVIDKIVALSVEGLAITKIGNNAYISSENREDTLEASYSIKATGISVNVITSRTKDMYIYRLYRYTGSNLNDSYYNNTSYWKSISVIEPNPLPYNNIWYSSSALKKALINFVEKEDGSCDFIVSSGSIRLDGIENLCYLNFGGVRFNVPQDYDLVLHYNGLVDLIKNSDVSKYPVMYLIHHKNKNNKSVGFFIDIWKEKQEDINNTKNILIGQNRLKCTYNYSDGSLTIDRISTVTYSNIIYLSYGNPAKFVEIKPTWPIQLQKYTALVYDITNNELIERKYSVSNNPEYHNVPVASNEILLLANSVNRIQGGALMSYIFNSNFYRIDRKLLPTPKRMHNRGSTQGIFIYGENLCLCSHSNDEHTNFVNNSIVNKNTFEFIKYVQHNFGHLNTVNYNENNDCLMFSDSSKGIFANHIYIIPNWSDYAESHDKWDFNELEKVTIDIEWLYTELNEHKANPAWGPNWGENDLIYVASKDNTVLRCLRLGKGTDQLSHGTYIPASVDNYNGTYTVINTYTSEQTICVNGDSHIVNGCFVTGARFGSEGKSGILALRIQDTDFIKPELWQIDKSMGDGQGLTISGDEFFFATDSYIYVWDLSKFNL